MGLENPVHLAFVAIVALLVLGPKRLPELARALGKGVREFREAINTDAPPPEPRVTEATQPPPAAASSNGEQQLAPPPLERD